MTPAPNLDLPQVPTPKAMPLIQVMALPEHILDASLLRASYIYSPEQQVSIRNLITDCTNDLFALEFDAVNPVEFAKSQAYYKGQVAILNFLLERSDAITNPVPMPE